jgi:hypothetical protein
MSAKRKFENESGIVGKSKRRTVGTYLLALSVYDCETQDAIL